ncbi:phosphonate C-P lyase system protein PhnG [Cytobacillus purgationiresistens]|uniref:Alpha-D-ribose 1-methylphosphonate 5-triphosphate synthase subunit PhnG n=1 Tax=Cytobacillus purgationiresistens TaxID=863449 RepID=A0ABU0ALE0_9BACI|nr:phosphonate C-P lyase system protein PhnG [Cytobacillus purgationiresistens]MDQ0271845.1 alpha-D-ribose 1-methylphosphonate 5-triphosphate synthase subunit PhnG [Cytobacillus purgationiresistens]
MNRRRRTKILIQGSPSLAKEMAAEVIQKYQVSEILAPQYGLTMVKMRETAKNSLFYIGEVLITEAKVEIKGEIGIGLVVGMKDDLAQHLAVIDAAYQVNLPISLKWDEKLMKLEKKLLVDQAKEQAEIFKTKVQFHTMDV